MPFENIFPRILYAVDDGGGAGGGAGGPQDQGGAGDKSTENKGGAGSTTTELPDDPVKLKELLKAEREAHGHTISVHTEMKTKLTKREQEEAKAKEENLKKAGQFEALYQEAAPKLEQATKTIERQEAALAAYLKTELAAVPDSLKALIPDGDSASKLEWISKAKAAGAFTASTSKPGKGPDGSPPPGSKGATMSTADFKKLPSKDRSAFMAKGGVLTD